MTSADEPAVPPIAPFRNRALGIIATATLLALLYFARDVLVPVTLAFILSLLIAPLVRVLRRIGLGQTLSVLAAVFVLALSFGAIAAVIGSQLMRMAGSVPQYEQTLEDKLETLNKLTVRRVNRFTAEAGRALNRNPQPPQPQTLEPDAASNTPIPVELHEAPANSLQILQRVLGSIWLPIEMTGRKAAASRYRCIRIHTARATASEPSTATQTVRSFSAIRSPRGGGSRRISG